MRKHRFYLRTNQISIRESEMAVLCRIFTVTKLIIYHKSLVKTKTMGLFSFIEVSNMSFISQCSI